VTGVEGGTQQQAVVDPGSDVERELAAGPTGVTRRHRAGVVANQLGSLLGLVLLCVGLAAINGRFRTYDNYMLILVFAAPIAIIAAGQTFVILTGGIDLSVGSLTGLCTVVTSLWMTTGFAGISNVTPWLALAMGVGFGLGVGLLQGLLITSLKMPPFIITLGSFNLLVGFAQVLDNGSAISVDGTGWDWIYTGTIGTIPIPFVIAFAVFLVGWIVLRFMRLGRYTYAIGGNEQAVRLSGVPVNRYKIAVYAISGLCCGIASALILAQSLGGNQNNGQGAELSSIAAVVIGGTSLAGGIGSLWGSLIGAVILVGVVPDALVMLNVPPQWNQVVVGATVILAVLVDVLRKRERAKKGRFSRSPWHGWFARGTSGP
jgi:ribose transport system permease protein